MKRTLDSLEAELVGERARRETTERRDRVLRNLNEALGAGGRGPAGVRTTRVLGQWQMESVPDARRTRTEDGQSAPETEG